MEAKPDGLLILKLLDGQGGSSDYAFEDVADWQASRGSLWLHFDLGAADTREWMVSHSGLNEIAIEALLSEETRPRTINRGDNLLLSLRGINPTLTDDPGDMISLRIWTDGYRVISTRFRALSSTDDLLADLDAGRGPVDVQSLLCTWVSGIVGRMKDTIEGFEDQVLAAEERVLNGDTEGLRVELAKLRKHTVSVRRYLSPQREAMSRLVNENLAWLDENARLRLREINDRLMRYIEDVDEIRDRASLAQDELLAKVSEEINARSYVFTVVATIFLPLGFFTGLMGINVGGMPGVENELAFWVVVGLCVAITVGLGLIFRKKRWL